MGELGIIVRTEPAADGCTEIGVVGPLTHATASALRDALRRAIGSDPTDTAPRLRLNLACCTGIDVDGLLALSVAQHAARVRGGDLLLDHVPPLVERRLRQHGFGGLMNDPDADDPS